MASELNTLEIHNILQQAIGESQIIQRFHYGHNLLQSPVQIDEIFSMIDTIIDKVHGVVNDIIPDINMAPYAEGKIDPTRANLCWIELRDGYYGLILNTSIGATYKEINEEDLQNLILTGQFSSWYLISKIQNISYLLSSEDSATVFFRSLIIEIIEKFLSDHEKSKVYHPAGFVDIKNIDHVFAYQQIQNTSSMIELPDTVSTNGGEWSQSIITTSKNKVCWQSTRLKLQKIKSEDALDIIDSKYLNERSDVKTFLPQTHKEKYSTNPNVFCFISIGKFITPYNDLNYEIECQLYGSLTLKYENGTTQTIVPDAQPLVISKGKNEIIFMSILKLDNSITNRIVEIEDLTENNNTETLDNLHLMCSCTGVIERFTA